MARLPRVSSAPAHALQRAGRDPSTATFSATPHSDDAIANQTVPTMNIFRRP